MYYLAIGIDSLLLVLSGFLLDGGYLTKLLLLVIIGHAIGIGIIMYKDKQLKKMLTCNIFIFKILSIKIVFEAKISLKYLCQ